MDFAHDVGEAVFLLQFLVQEPIGQDEVAVLQGLGDGHQDLIVFKGLQDVVEGPLLHGGDGLLHGAEGGHDDHRQVRIKAVQLLQEFDAAHLGHLHVRQDQVQVGGAGDLEGLRGAGGGEDLIARLTQQGLHDRQIIDFVVND